MLPNDTASSLAVPALLHDPDSRVTSPLRDFELGALALNNASGGLQQIVWTLDYVGGMSIGLTPAGGERIPVFDQAGVTDLALAFDQNMRPAIAYVVSNSMRLRWFDSLAGAFVTTNFGAAISPRLSLDDKRNARLSQSDVILAYIKDNALYYRQQRDRYETERLLRSNLPAKTRLRTVGMGKGLRLQFELVMG